MREELGTGVCIAAIVVAGGVLAGCAGDGKRAAEARASPKTTIAFLDGSYSPPKVRVTTGMRVTFVNRSPVSNTAETDGVDFFEFDRKRLDRQNLFDIHVLNWGEAESVELDTPGVYRYHSSLDDRMKGVIEVVAPE